MPCRYPWELCQNQTVSLPEDVQVRQAVVSVQSRRQCLDPLPAEHDMQPRAQQDLIQMEIFL